MNTCTKPAQKQTFTKLSLVGVGLCALCCALPIIAAILGLGSLSAMAFYLEKAGMGLILLGTLLSVVIYIRNRKKAARCGATCNC